MTDSKLSPEEITLEPEKRSQEIMEFEQRLLSKIVGQDRAVRKIVNMYQICLAKMTTPGKPIGNLLFLGPTGSGKTRIVEASAEILFGNPRAFIKIDCAEFQHSHEIAKLIGSPPGYLGHRETPAMLTQEAIDQYQNQAKHVKISFILFDEIEKAHDALWQLLLGILDKATLALGDNRKVDFSQCIIFMTSNLGSKEMSEFITGGIGFAPPAQNASDFEEIDKKIYKTALEAAKHKFTPEFMNRIDRVIVFRTLTQEHLKQILEIELNEVQNRFLAQKNKEFIFHCTQKAKDFLLKEGVDFKCGARELKRAIERHFVFPISNLIATEQISFGDTLNVDFDSTKSKLKFSKKLPPPNIANAANAK